MEMSEVGEAMKTLEELSGIGQKKIKLFNKLGIYTILDLLYYYPRRYDILERTDMRKVVDGDKVVIDGIIESTPIVSQLSAKLKRIVFRVSNIFNVYNICVFNQEYLCRELKYGVEVIIFGKYDQKRNTIVASEVRLGRLPEERKIESIYSTTEGLNQKVICKSIESLLEETVDLVDYIPDYLIDRYHFPKKLWSVSQIHCPVDVSSYRKARQRLKYEEFFLYLMKIHYFKLSVRGDNSAIQRSFDEKEFYHFIDKLSFSLTVDQERVVEEIKLDLLSDKRMNRLIQGDVGSGKTIVAFLASYINFLSGYQTALMVPTEILANQHYQNAISLFQDTGMKIVLLTSRVVGKKKEKVIKQIQEGNADFIIGTQSLIQEKVIYPNLGLIITDEQHRFGVNQRNDLKNKGMFPDLLSMSATPIPRTYALTIYGDMDVSNIHTKPSGRKEVITMCKNYDDILDVLGLMKKELDEGHQIYVIAPSIESDKNDGLDNVLNLKEKMRVAFGKKWNIEMVHGKLDTETKSKIMNSFEEGTVQILISTTVIEVGVNVPNASMIVIFQANLFGLSTLHQLRGRVGRSNIQSYCILFSKEKCDRLNLLEQTCDGFKISEYDFQCRGEGDLFGVRQSGVAEFKLADIKKDFELLVRVKKDVDEFLKEYILKGTYKSYLDLLK